MRREISNPSDYATIDCTDKIAASIAIVIMGQGHYGIIDDEGDEGMPIFLFGGHDEWFKGKFGKSFEEAIETTGISRIADALDTIQLDGKRTSMNDFTARAHRLAKELRNG